MTRVKVTKIKAVDTPVCPTPPMCEHIPGEQSEGTSLPCEYWITGILMEPITIGKNLLVTRDCRNGINASGIFATTTVVEITPTGFKTLNSEYLLETLE
jgi:hypothetical protein